MTDESPGVHETIKLLIINQGTLFPSFLMITGALFTLLLITVSLPGALAVIRGFRNGQATNVPLIALTQGLVDWTRINEVSMNSLNFDEISGDELAMFSARLIEEDLSDRQVDSIENALWKVRDYDFHADLVTAIEKRRHIMTEQAESISLKNSSGAIRIPVNIPSPAPPRQHVLMRAHSNQSPISQWENRQTAWKTSSSSAIKTKSPYFKEDN